MNTLPIYATALISLAPAALHAAAEAPSVDETYALIMRTLTHAKQAASILQSVDAARISPEQAVSKLNELTSATAKAKLTAQEYHSQLSREQQMALATELKGPDTGRAVGEAEEHGIAMKTALKQGRYKAQPKLEAAVQSFLKTFKL